MRERVAELGGDLVIEPVPSARNPDRRPPARPGATVTEPIRVLIADDHPLFRDGLTALLHDGPDTELAGAAATGTEAVDLARETQPDVVVMDLHMPGLNGIEATRRIVADSPHIAVLVLTMFDDDDSIFSALRAGARGYLLKGADQEQIRRGHPRRRQRRDHLRGAAGRPDARLLHRRRPPRRRCSRS